MESIGVNPSALSRLRRWNLGLSLVHGGQAAAVLLLANGFAITVTSQFPSGPPGSTAPAPEPLFHIAVGPAVAAFLVLAMVDHLLTATVFRSRYEADLRTGLNRFRWIEYSLSATIMMILIGFYNGLTGITEVVLIVGANIAMILFGWLQELMNPPGRTRTTMLPFWFGCIAGGAPWVALGVNLIGASNGSANQVPGFVYGIVASLFVFFMSFALNQWLQYRRVGKWADYGYGEKVYLALSLIAKSALAWQIFGGSLAG